MPCLVLGDDPEYLACAVNKYTKRFYSIRKEKYQKKLRIWTLFYTLNSFVIKFQARNQEFFRAGKFSAN